MKLLWNTELHIIFVNYLLNILHVQWLNWSTVCLCKVCILMKLHFCRICSVPFEEIQLFCKKTAGTITLYYFVLRILKIWLWSNIPLVCAMLVSSNFLHWLCVLISFPTICSISKHSPGNPCSFFKLHFDLNDYAAKNSQIINVANVMGQTP